MPDLRISAASVDDRSESDIRLNSYNPSLVLAAANDLNLAVPSNMPHFASTDGGANWATSELPLEAGETFHSDPAVDWTSDGLAWSIAMGIDGAGNSRLRAYSSDRKSVV